MAEEISVSLAPHWYRYIHDAVSNRRFASIDDAVEAGLRALEADEAKADRLERLLAEGEASGDAGPWDLETFLREAQAGDAARQAA